MTEAERDALYARVFATPAGAELLADVTARNHFVIALHDVEVRLARERRRWAAPADPDAS